MINPDMGFPGTMMVHFDNQGIGFRDSCCGVADYTQFCAAYFKRRPINTGTGYSNPVVGE